MWGLIAAFVVLLALEPQHITMLPGLVNWPTIATLTGLLFLATAMESSGALQSVTRALLTRHMSERRLALLMVTSSAGIAMVLTNDVALFVVVPLALAAGKWARLPLRRLVVFEALAVNAGSMLTPIGNPQNIFLWQYSGVSFERFAAHMLIPFAISMLCLVALTALVFSGRRLVVHASRGGPASVDKVLLWTAALLFVPFLVLANFHYPAAALALVAVVFVFACPGQLRRVDWSLIAVFVLMFVDLGLIAQYRPLQGLELSNPTVLYLAGALLSQVLSNVPAAIVLARHGGDWTIVSWAVNVGAFGTVIASLANLIALRLGRQRGSLWALHAWSLPFFGVVGGCVWLCLRFV